MKLLTTDVSCDVTTPLLEMLDKTYRVPLLFHFFWKGVLNEKHYLSIKSCRYFHPDAEIILWIEACPTNEWVHKLLPICKIHKFNFIEEKNSTFLKEYPIPHFIDIPYYSDYIRLMLLYKYGGIWCDLDIFFLQNFSPLIPLIGENPAVYQWEHQPFPNNAVIITPNKENIHIRALIEYIYSNKRHWGMLTGRLTYDTPIDLLVLPCSWFDIGWIINKHDVSCNTFMLATPKPVLLHELSKVSFCFHWHNKWNTPIHPTSPLRQLANQLGE